ncbi:MAG TPA: SAM-dependent methyltransferase, partial [Casimicrobiaceae bacterium]|nr:SAM-dependent methyltransferase [Casimicrobiaceae bacterium]
MSVRARELAALADALAAVLPLTSPADVALHQFFRRHPKLGHRDRGFIAEGVFAALRRLRSLTSHAQTKDPRRLAIASAIRELGLSLRELEPALSADELSWARELKARRSAAAGAEAVDLPDWLWDALGEALPDERDALARSWLTPGPLDLRINPLKTTREAAQAALAADDIVAAPTPYSPLGLRVEGKPALQRHALFQ